MSYSQGSTNVTASVVDRIKRKEKGYRDPVQKTQDDLQFLAESLAKGGEVEKALLQAAEGMDESAQEELKDFLVQQRERLKKVSIKNVENSREIDTFMGALNMIRGEPQSSNVQLPDYDELVKSRMEQTRATKASMQLDITDEEWCRGIRQKLGEKEPKKRRGGGAGNDSDDDELEIVNDGSDAANQFKCPITTLWYEEPMKSKVCGHTYSLAGLKMVIQNGRHGQCNCPVAGCSNGQLSMTQCEPDRIMEMKVKKQRRREERLNQERMSQAAGVDSEGEE